MQARLVALGHRIEPAELTSQLFDTSTDAAVRAFQQQRGLIVDALVGPVTWQELVEACYEPGDRVLYLRYPYFRGDDVRALQDRLNVLGFGPGPEDGVFGQQTAGAVTEFQRNVGLEPDGIVGFTTLRALERLRPPLAGTGRETVRESEDLRSGGTLAERTVAIDPGHGPGEPGGAGPAGTSEAEAAYALAEALAESLRRRGARPELLRRHDEDTSAEDRVARANTTHADVLVSVHLNGHEDPSAEGSSSYYFGREGRASVSGRLLAELIQEEITTRLGLRDGRAHPKSFPILRGTRMTAVHIEPCFITNPKEERLLSEASFRRELAEAVARALEGFFAGRLPAGTA